MVNKRLDSEMTYYLSGYITNDKNLEVIRYEDIRVDTGARTYQFKVDEWLDRSDSPETLTMHKNLPFLGLTINQRATISKPAQKTLDTGAIKVRELNHTDVPHRMQSSERDTLHELSSSVYIDGNVQSQMLIMNCSYNDRPAFAKKRYFTIMAFLGLSSIYRNGLSKKLFETTYSIEKHVESIVADPQ